MAHFRLKHRRYKNTCMCKGYKRAGNSKERRAEKENAIRERMRRLED